MGNTKLVVMCDECLKWMCVYSQKKLSNEEKNEAVLLFEGISYSCGSSLNDIDDFEDCECDPDECECEEKKTVLAKLHMSKKLTCASPMEVAYYSVFKTEPLCIDCGREALFPEDPKKYYPLCNGCKEKGHKMKEKAHKAKNENLAK